MLFFPTLLAAKAGPVGHLPVSAKKMAQLHVSQWHCYDWHQLKTTHDICVCVWIKIHLPNHHLRLAGCCRHTELWTCEQACLLTASTYKYLPALMFFLPFVWVNIAVNLFWHGAIWYDSISSMLIQYFINQRLYVINCK